MTSLPAAPVTTTLGEAPRRGVLSVAVTVVAPARVATDATARAQARPAAGHTAVIVGLTRGQTGPSVSLEAELSAMGRGAARC